MNLQSAISFEKAFISVPVGKHKIKESEYDPAGLVSVVDQGQNLISGKTNQTEFQRDDGPYIVFGDHTRVVKFIDFPFVVGADGVRLYKASDKYEPEFLYRFMQSLKLPEDTYGRHSKYLKQIFVPDIGKAKQRQIVARLKDQLVEIDKAHHAAEVQLQEINLLPQKILSQVFADNARNEKGIAGKHNNIAVPLKALGTYINGRAFKPTDWEQAGLPIVRIANLNDPVSPTNFFSGEVDEIHKIDTGDILVSWSASLGTYVWDRGPAILNQHIFKVVPDSEVVDKTYLFYVLKMAIRGLSELVHGATMKHVTRPVFENYEVNIERSTNQQRQIAARLQAQLAEVAKARQAAEIRLQEIRLLPQKILSQAFEMPS